MIHSQSATSEIHPGLQENKIQIVTTVRKITSVRQILYAMGFFFFTNSADPQEVVSSSKQVAGIYFYRGV